MSNNNLKDLPILESIDIIKYFITIGMFFGVMVKIKQINLLLSKPLQVRSILLSILYLLETASLDEDE